MWVLKVFSYGEKPKNPWWFKLAHVFLWSVALTKQLMTTLPGMFPFVCCASVKCVTFVLSSDYCQIKFKTLLQLPLTPNLPGTAGMPVTYCLFHICPQRGTHRVPQILVTQSQQISESAWVMEKTQLPVRKNLLCWHKASLFLTCLHEIMALGS